MIDIKELQNFFKNAPKKKVIEKLKNYGVKFEENNLEKSINNIDHINVYYDEEIIKGFKIIHKKQPYIPYTKSGCKTLRKLECKHQCNFSYNYEVNTLNDNELILNVEQIEDLIEVCGENICIYAPYCKLYKNFIKHATWYKKIIRHNNNYRRIDNSLNATITLMYIKALYNLNMRIRNKDDVIKALYNNFEKSEIYVYIK